MHETTLHIPSFQGEFATAIVFAMIEGLRPGEGFHLICEQHPGELEHMLKEAKIPSLRHMIRPSGHRWEMILEKSEVTEAEKQASKKTSENEWNTKKGDKSAI